MRQNFYATTMLLSRCEPKRLPSGEAPHVHLMRACRVAWKLAWTILRSPIPAWSACLALAAAILIGFVLKVPAPIPPALERLAGAIDRADAALETIQILDGVAQADEATAMLIEAGLEAERLGYDLQRVAGRKAACEVNAALGTAQIIDQLKLELARHSGALGPDFAAHARFFREESRRLLTSCEQRR